MTIEVNYDGMRVLRQSAEHQATYLRSIQSFVNSGCSNTEAFSGFLSLFKGQYSDALSDVKETLQKGPQTADAVATNIRSNVRTYRTRDIQAAADLRGITPEIKAIGLPSFGPAGPMSTTGGPPVSAGEKHGADGTGAVVTVANEGGRQMMPHIPKNPWDDGPKGLNPLSPISLIGEGQGTVQATQSGIEAGEDIDDYDEFEKKHGKR